MLQFLRKAGAPFALEAGTGGEPTIRHVDETLILFRREDCAALVSSGRAMYLAKAVSPVVRQQRRPEGLRASPSLDR
ncbi:hypothetical protein [uncultured Desulfovibrio sp.]|uniref:hypothetical protein n=1 Tax=uncultured Desulfovibrio sp. TaxID=167968 RepID=UPI0026138FD6|nr:hypothetical protein [uncultured Desulfovibrio sp.]